MKICILSMQKVNNYGSVLQAFALKKIIEELGHDVCFIDIEPRESDNSVVDNVLVFPNEQMFYWSNVSQRIKAAINKYFFIRLFHRFQIKYRDKLLSDFRYRYLNINEKDNDSIFDYCIIGSDEVFNALQRTYWGFTSQLFGQVKNAHNVITYAACCGYTTVEKLNPKEMDIIREAFNNISAFSVRDENTKIFVEKIALNKKIQINLDPALLFDFAPFLKNINICLPHKYCLIYAYKNRIKDKHDIKVIQSFCKKNGMKIMIVGDDQFWNISYRPFSPFELIYAFSKAEFVITDTFHGTVFSAKYAKKFAIVAKSSNGNKLNDLVKRLKLEKHLLDDYDDLPDKYVDLHDHDNIECIINKERERMYNYFFDNLVK